MRNKFIAIFSVLLALLTFSACEPDNTLASSDWNGNWKLNEEIIFPQTKTNIKSAKSSSGTIRIDPNDERKIIISGELFGLSSSESISASATSSSASFNQKVGIYTLEGTATLSGKDQIKFQIKITTENNNAASFSRIAIRI
jgi:hypothetical protein